MSSLNYLSKSLEGRRARCGSHCAFNEYVSLGEYLKKKDPTRRPRKDYYNWTKRDSKTRGIDHEKLFNAWKIMEQRFNYCQKTSLRPGCASLLHATWFSDQKERIISIIEKRAPHLKRCSCSNSAFELLKKMGVRLVGPIQPLYEAPREPSSVITVRPETKNIILSSRDGKRILTIPFDQTDFIQINTEKNKKTDEYTNVGILVSHTDGKQSYYVISAKGIVHRQVNVDTIKTIDGQ